MQVENRILDDIAKLAVGALGVAAGVRREAETLVRQRLAALLGDLDTVPREEFDAVRDMAAKAREEQERLAERVARLEQALAGKAGKSAPKKPARAKRAAPRPHKAKP